MFNWMRILVIKNKVVSALLAFAFIFIATKLVLADEAVAEVRLDKTVTKFVSGAFGWGAGFEPIRVSLVIKNLSDRIQTVNLKKRYHFWLIKASDCGECAWLWWNNSTNSYLPVVAEGYLAATYGKIAGASTDQIQPHTEKVEAFAVLPGYITNRSTYKGNLGTGAYLLNVEVPTGLPGTDASATTQVTFFVN